MPISEPGTTSAHYDPSLVYTAPLGRLPVLGKLRAEVDLLRAQMKNEQNIVVNRDLAQIDSNAKITADIAAQATQVADNTRKIDGELAALAQQTTNDTQKTLNDTNRATEEIAASQAKTANEDQQTINDTTRTADNTSKVAAEVSALNQQTLNDTNKTTAEIERLTTQNTNDTTLASNDTSKTNAEVAALTAKNAAEVDLLEQKTATELAQTSDTIPLGTAKNTVTTVNGVVEKQKNLFQKQTDGFDRDAEQKLAKLYLDTWSVRQTTDGANAGTAGISETDIKTILNTARTGLGIATI